MSKGLQDTFIVDDDEEETCPLCVEEFDLTDKGFKPCPCGYQICQFCYNNVKNNMNGLCPACRRPYNDSDIQYKLITPEEAAAHKARQAQKQKRTQQLLQKERQRAEADSLSRKHLAGLRVVQKNLVYVTGLSPNVDEDELLQTLRGKEYFGQYGKIIKIVVSKARDKHDSVGVYVTYESKEDAASCIAAVDGSPNGERTLRAQFGTTKYCSAYLRGDTCMNRSCMFLHEPGEANESYSRADLSALNAGSTQHGGSRQAPPQSQQPMSAAQPMVRQPSDQAHSPELSERPGLPSTASWASRPAPAQASRAESRVPSGSIGSPAPSAAVPVTAAPVTAATVTAAADSMPVPEPPAPTIPAATPIVAEAPQPIPVRAVKPRIANPIAEYLKGFNAKDLRLAFSTASVNPEDMDIVMNFPALFDPEGGAKRRLHREREEAQRRQEVEAQTLAQAQALEDADDAPEMSGSLQLGGEPEEPQALGRAVQSSAQEGALDRRFQFGASSESTTGLDDQDLTNQHNLLLRQTLKSPNLPVSFQQNAFQQQQSQPPGHARNVSRFSFANDSSASVKPILNQKLLQTSLPTSGNPIFDLQHQQPQTSQFFTNNVQGPPPGLKTTGTPPVSGGMTFGQGHGFTTGGTQYGAGGRNMNDDMMRDLLRGRNASVASASEAAKHDANFPPLGGHPATPVRQASVSSFSQLQDPTSRRSTPTIPPGFEADTSRRGTPSLPPGLAGKPLTALPDLEGLGSRPSSRASLKRAVSGAIVPVVPLRPGTPAARGLGSRSASRAASPVKEVEEDKGIAIETPTKKPKPVTGRDLSKVTQTASQEKTDLGAGLKENMRPGATDQKPTAGPSSSAETSSQKLGGRFANATVPSTASPALDTETHKASARVPQASKATATVKSFVAEPAQKTDSGSASSTAIATAPEVKTDTPATTQQAAVVAERSTAEPSSKRKHLGKLNIAAAVDQEKAPIAGTATPSTPVAGTPSVQSKSALHTPIVSDSPSAIMPVAVAKPPPRTLRVVQTPKVETPSAATPPPQAFPGLAEAAVKKLPSRQPSVASMNFPGTPSSEQVSMSDNISMTSTSMSRANSPPPSKVGSAPIRAKTKAQQRKERKERAQLIEDEMARVAQEKVDAVAEEPAREAIISRKKKEPKAKEVKAVKPKGSAAKSEVGTADTTPTASRPVSPRPKPVVAVQEVVAPAAQKPSTPTKAPLPPPQPTREPSPPPTPTLSPLQIIADLHTRNPEIHSALESLFRTSSAPTLKPSQSITPVDVADPASWKSPDFNIRLTREEVEDLLAGSIPAIRYGGEEGRMWDRGLVTPTGAHLRALSQELERRFLELENRVRAEGGMVRWRPTKPQDQVRLPGFDLEALRAEFERADGRGVSVMEQMVQDGSSMKKGAFLVDEAARYINEFVMPPVTPPPQVGKGTGKKEVLAEVGRSVEFSERVLSEARRAADEKEGALRRVIRRNKKMLGLG